MKNKILPFGLVAIIIGFTAFFLSSAGFKSEQKYEPEKSSVKENIQIKQEALSYIAKLRNNQITGKIDPNDVLKAGEQIAKSKTKSGNAKELNWVGIGPDNFGGRTRAVLFDNQDATASTIYAGSVSGGIWKSTNVGSSWNQVNTSSGTACLAVSCMIQATDGTIYAGTGEGFETQDYTEFGGIVGNGLYKSTDGDNFELVPGTEPIITQDNDTVDWAYINELAIDDNTNRIYASTNTGLKYLDQGSETWNIPEFVHDSVFYEVDEIYNITCDSIEINGEEITMFNPDTTGKTIDTIPLLISRTMFPLIGNSPEVKTYDDGSVITLLDNLTFTSDDGTQFMNIAKYPNDPHFITKSFSSIENNLTVTNIGLDTTYAYNDSANWAPLPGNSLCDLPNDNVAKIDFAIAPSDQNIIYANVITSMGFLYNIYRSSNKGATWNIILPGANTTIDMFEGEGIYASTLSVYPNNPDKILVGGVNLWQGTKHDEGFFEWNENSISLSFFQLTTFYIHSGHHAYVFRPGIPSQFVIASDGGISISLDGDEQFMTMNKNYFTSQFYTVAISGNKKEILGGTQDNGILYIKGEGNPAVEKKAEQILGGHGCYNALSLINPNVYIFARPEGEVYRSETRGDDVSNTFLGSGMASGEFINPFMLWECFNDQNSKDSIKFYARDRSYETNETISVGSNNFSYPFDYTLPHALEIGDSIMIKDIIQSKFFWAQKDKVFMTIKILDFAGTPEWFQIADISGLPQCLGYSKDANFLYVGTDEGKLYRIANIAHAFSYDEADVNSPYCTISTNEIPIIHEGGIENTQAVTSVYIDPQDPKNVIVTLGNYGNTDYVYLCTNALDQNPEFKSIQGDPDNDGLPQMPVYSSIIEMENSNLAIIGTEKGVYVSENIFDASPIWEKQSNNILETPVFMLKQQVTLTHGVFDTLTSSYDIFPPVLNFGYIYGATYGRGVFVDNTFHIVGIDDDDFEDKKQSEISLFPNPAIDQLTVSFELDKSSNALIIIYDLTGKIVKSIDLQHESVGTINCKINVDDLQKGTYILRLIEGKKQTSAKFIVAQ